MANMVVNIYKNARIKSGLKREPVAEELCINVRTLDRYESLSDNTKPDDSLVANMCKLYGYPYLAWQHIKEGPLGPFFPDITEEEFSVSTLRMINDFNEVSKILSEIVNIASDGKITPDEVEKWEQHRQKLLSLSGSINSLIVQGGVTSA